MSSDKQDMSTEEKKAALSARSSSAPKRRPGEEESKSGSSSSAPSSKLVAFEEKDLATYNESVFDDWWKGLDRLSGSGDGYKMAMDWWHTVPAKYKKHVAKACVMFFDKPPRFLAAGEVKRVGSKKLTTEQMIDPRLVRFLPRLPEDYKPEEGQSDKRAGWREFRNVNVSMARRVAKMLILKSATEYSAVNLWIEKYGGTFGKISKESVGYKKLLENEAAKRIFDAHEADVLSSKDHWFSEFKK